MIVIGVGVRHLGIRAAIFFIWQQFCSSAEGLGAAGGEDGCGIPPSGSAAGVVYVGFQGIVFAWDGGNIDDVERC